jgi:transposase-like protein
LADKYGKTKETIRKHLDQHQQVYQCPLSAQPIVIGIDCSFFGRGYGIILARCPGLKKNLYWKEITTESKEAYEEVRRFLEASGFNIQAVVIDAKYGIKQVFADVAVQICQFHQKQIVKRYLTSKPKTVAGQELKLITDDLTKLDEQLFAQLLNEWYGKWKEFLKERTFAQDNKHWWYTHRRLRSAYRSLNTNLPYLFSYQKYPELCIPNTNNSLEGYFSKLKKLLNNHNGLKRCRRYKLIQTILNSS